ncbi:MFS transporter [Actinoplanes sp. RD1]|uniref:MFS transporter n=1 Tax=Actinoplanes sp. RD1 TaxID=3064538 RepID=UPI0027415365|nr:MFS transporter [Actinoplanes sp. RD1]
MTDRKVLLALSGMLLALFVANLSSTIVSTALPQMLAALHGSRTQYAWIVTATLLATTATTPIWGKFADLFRKQNILQISVVVFVAGSLACAFSQNAGQLIAARALQGVGVGGVQALAGITIAAMIAPRDRGKYQGYLSAATSSSTIGGPLLGGLIVDTSWLGWRWCYLIGIPIAAAAMVVIRRTMNLPVHRRDSVRIDYAGAALIAAGVSLLLIWVSFVDVSFAWVSWPTAAMVGGALVLLAAATWVETRAAEPVVPPRVLRQRTTILGIVGSLAVGTGLFGSSVFLSQYFQLSRGHTATEAGLLSIPMVAGTLISSIGGGRLVSRTGKVKPFLVAGAVLLAAGFLGLGLIDQHTPMPLIATAMLVAGLGTGLTVQNFVLVVQNDTHLKDIGAASSTVTFFRSLGGAIGVAVLGAILARDVARHLAADSSPAAVQTAYGQATGLIFQICAAVAVLGITAALLLKPVTLLSAADRATALTDGKEPMAEAATR